MCSYHVPKLFASTLWKREISSNQWVAQSCFQGALGFFLLSFGSRVGRLEVGGEVFFSSCIGGCQGGQEGRIYFPFHQ
jgi:hypothetical protein